MSKTRETVHLGQSTTKRTPAEVGAMAPEPDTTVRTPEQVGIVAAREIVGSGTIGPGVVVVTESRDLHHSQGVEVAAILSSDDEPSIPARSALSELIDREVAAANARASTLDEMRASGLYPDKGDPGTVVGLDGFTPSVETAGDGNPERTDPNPSRR